MNSLLKLLNPASPSPCQAASHQVGLLWHLLPAGSVHEAARGQAPGWHAETQRPVKPPLASFACRAPLGVRAGPVQGGSQVRILCCWQIHGRAASARRQGVSQAPHRTVPKRQGSSDSDDMPIQAKRARALAQQPQQPVSTLDTLTVILPAWHFLNKANLSHVSTARLCDPSPSCLAKSRHAYSAHSMCLTGTQATKTGSAIS